MTPARQQTQTRIYDMRFKETKLKEIVSQPPVSTYLLLTLAFFVALQTMNLCMEASIPNYYPMNHLRRFADAMLFALPAFFLYRKRFLFLYLTMADLYILANVWYYRTFMTPMPLTAFFQVENLDGLWISIMHSMRLIDLGIFLPVAVFAVYYLLIINKKRRYSGGDFGTRICDMQFGNMYNTNSAIFYKN